MALDLSLLWGDSIDPAIEPRRILITRGDFIDPAREDRKVPWKIYYPVDDAGEPLPVVIWSHGLGGSRDGAGFISRFVSSHGYVVVHVQHKGTDSSLWEGQPGHPWDAIRRATISRETVLNRFRDVPFVLDQLMLWAKDNPEIGARMDFSRIGMSGHSFGASTTQMMAGQKLGPDADHLYSMAEPRFTAGILYSPVPSPVQTDHRAVIYKDISIPLLMMTGTADESPIEGFGYDRRMEVFELSGGPDQNLLMLNGGDHMVYNGSRGQLGDNPLREPHETIIKMASLAWWDAYLKGDRTAHDWVVGGGLARWMDDLGTLTHRA